MQLVSLVVLNAKVNTHVKLVSLGFTWLWKMAITCAKVGINFASKTTFKCGKYKNKSLF